MNECGPPTPSTFYASEPFPTSLHLYPIWMNVASFNPWLLEFRIAWFSEESGWYLFCSLVVIFAVVMQGVKCFYLHLHLDQKFRLNHILKGLYTMIKWDSSQGCKDGSIFSGCRVWTSLDQCSRATYSWGSFNTGGSGHRGDFKNSSGRVCADSLANRHNSTSSTLSPHLHHSAAAFSLDWPFYVYIYIYI